MVVDATHLDSLTGESIESTRVQYSVSEQVPTACVAGPHGADTLFDYLLTTSGIGSTLPPGCVVA